MGKATITGGGTDGRYAISIDVGAATKAARLAALNKQVSDLTLKVAAQTLLVEQATAEVQAARVNVDIAIDLYVLATQESDDPETYKDEFAEYTAATKVLSEKQGVLAPLKISLDILKRQLASAQKTLTATINLQVLLTRNAWCVDFTENGTGLVGTIEIPGESDLVLIKPQCPAPVAADGELVVREFMTPEQVYFNAAILPGWQKWKPMYRRGVMTSIDYENDRAAVTLDEDFSSAQSLPVNQTTELVNVPVVYMSCNAGAFEVGDRCVVQFTGYDWSTPTVIGFVDNPKRCGFKVTYTYSVYPPHSAGAFPPSLAEQDVSDGSWVVVTAALPGSPFLFRRWNDPPEPAKAQTLRARNEAKLIANNQGYNDTTVTALYYDLAEWFYQMGYPQHPPTAGQLADPNLAPPFGSSAFMTWDQSTGVNDEFGNWIHGSGDEIWTVRFGWPSSPFTSDPGLGANSIVWTGTFRRVMTWEGWGFPFRWDDATFVDSSALVFTFTVADSLGGKTVTASFAYGGSPVLPVYYSGVEIGVDVWSVLGGNLGYRAPYGLSPMLAVEYLLRNNFSFVSQSAQTQYDTA